MVRYAGTAEVWGAIHPVGFEFIRKVLMSPRYLFYDPAQNGGLWLGKAYGGPGDNWKRDPLHNISHGASTLQVARLFVLLQEGRIVRSERSAELKNVQAT